jgi:hypothetical protein
MDDQRFRHRTTIGLILLAAVFVAIGFLPVGEWLAFAMRLIA